MVSRQFQGPPPPSYTMQSHAPPQSDDGSMAAKTIVGTLIGAAAGAAIAYAMVKGDSQSTAQEHEPMQFANSFPQLKAAAQSFFGNDDQQSQFRAIEAPAPPRSAYTTASNPRSTLTRSVTSKNPRASTIYDGSEYMENPRRASEGSIYSIPEDIPLRAIEYPPASNASQKRYACAPSTFISSYHEEKMRAPSSVHSSSTIKAPQSTTSRSHKSQHSTHSHAGKDNASVASSSRSARNIPLPTGSNATFYSSPSIHSRDGGKSHFSARNVPLPESVVDLDVASQVSPDDSISQVGLHPHRHRSHRSGSSKSSRADDRVSPADSVSQVSRASQRTAKEGSRAGSRRGSQAV